jgi:hypothetical protein
MLLPRIDVVRQRDANRQEKHVFELWGHLDASARQTLKVGLWLDTSELNAEETVDEILKRSLEATVSSVGR